VRQEPKRLTSPVTVCLEPRERHALQRIAERDSTTISQAARLLLRRGLSAESMLDPLCGTGGSVVSVSGAGQCSM